jgi:hypothetical protein
MGNGSAKRRPGRRSRKPPTAAGEIRGTGLPAKDSVREILPFVSPKRTPYRILRTTEVDSYEPPLKPPKTRKRAR